MSFAPPSHGKLICYTYTFKMLVSITIFVFKCSFLLLHLFISVCVCARMRVCAHPCTSRDHHSTACGNHFSCFHYIWGTGSELKFLGLVVSTFTYIAI